MSSVVTLYLDPEPADALDHLHAVDPSLAARVEHLLDQVEREPGAEAVRRRYLRPPGLWMLTVRTDDADDTAVLWDLDGQDPVIRYIGPASFA